MRLSPLFRRLLLHLLLAALWTIPAAAQEDVSVRIETRTYAVSGVTIDAIAASIRQNRPRDVGRYIGETTFNFAWNYEFASSDGRCRIVRPKVDIAIRMTIPEHEDAATLPPDAARFWRRFITALERHEQKHVEDFRRIGARIPAALASVSAGNCLSAGFAANRRGNEFVAEAQASADIYDMQTSHGVTEGAAFPGL